MKILAYDLGTSGVKACVFDECGNLMASEYGRYDTFYDGCDIRQQKPDDWWKQICISTTLLASKINLDDVVAIGISGHSLATIPISKEGNLLTEKTPIWSDARAKKQADSFFKTVPYEKWYYDTGCGFPRHLYSIFKQMWLKENDIWSYENAVCFLGSKDYINFKLTGNFATDRSYASGSGIYLITKGCYSDAYIKAADLDIEKQPKVYDSTDIIGHVTKTAAETLGIKEGIPVVAGGVDNACMTLGANCKEEGDGYASLGTSAWITVSSSKPSLDFNSKIYSFAHVVKGQYIPSVGIFSSGSSLEWAIKNMFPNIATSKDVYMQLSEKAMLSPIGSNGIFFIPNLAGGSSFDPAPDVRGLFAGLDLKQDDSDVIRSVYEGIAMHLRYAYEFMKKDAPIKNKLLLVGGGAKSDFWRMLYAEIFGISTVKTKVVQDAASLGAAALAAVGTELWDNFDRLDEAHGRENICEPSQENIKKYNDVFKKYKQICMLTKEIATISR